LALGSDTGGSIRQPAALCGIAGLKPTYGRVSRFGLVAFASSLDQIGPLAHNVKDLALVQGVIEGHDPKDSTSVPSPYPLPKREREKAVRLGIPKEYFVAGMDPEVQKAIGSAIKQFEKQGNKIVEISLPHTPYAIATYYIVATAEASSNLARYDGVKYGLRQGADGKVPSDLLDLYCGSRAAGFGPEVKRRIILGTYVLSAGYYDAYYLKALKVRSLIHTDFQNAFGLCDAILTPTSPTPAFTFGEKTDDPLQMYLSDIFTISVNLAGIPGMSIPCGFTSSGLPIGMQILGKPFDEPTMLDLAESFQSQTDFHKQIPVL
jgi:aspartyl-tRNA(Asn)/glutamyl-tRNA(Gln) amidotransferase subunit A